MLWTICPSPAPRQSGNRVERYRRLAKQDVQQLGQRLLPLRPDGVIDVRRVQAGRGADGGEMTAPDDRDRRKPRPYRLRHEYRGSQLRATHHADTNSIDLPAFQRTHGSRNKVAVDIPVNDAGCRTFRRGPRTD